MIEKAYILAFKSLALKTLCLITLCFGTVLSNKLNAQSITVFAGNDQIVCANDTLNLNILNASILGAVSNGYWFSNGTGNFLPIQQYNRFSITQQYIPSAADIIAGFVELVLVSDDPDGVGPQVQVTDQVKISFLGNITMVCNSNLNISLGPDCTQKVTPSMLVTNLQHPIGYYTLTIKNQYNQPIANSILTNEHIGKVLEYNVGHECGTNTCWGFINVQDKLAPPLFCTNKTVLCGINTLPDSLGFPIPSVAKAKKIGVKKYRVLGLDACGPATLTYNDVYLDLKCVNDLQGKITRSWSAVDSFGNSSTCTQVITIKNRTLAQVVLPPNFDGIAKSAFECNGIWPKLPNGFPSTDTTGIPLITGCVNLEATYTDARFEQCGASFNVLRKWTIINWCGTLTTEHNQLIKIKDSKPPIFDCPANITLTTAAYDCANGIDTLPYPKNIFDCSTYQLKVSIGEKNANIDYSYLVFSSLSGKALVSNLPIGIYIASYIMIDACGNSDTCNASITVKDNIVPIAICDQVTKVSLLNTGTARLLATAIDDGSFDNCQIASFKVAKMKDTCMNHPFLFSDYVDFCCAESGKKIMTVLRVTDNFGNSNSCMVEVIVEDKLKPIIYCPSNLTISCKNDIDTSKLNIYGSIANNQINVTPIIINDFYNSGIVGYNGYYTDNCNVIISSSVIANLQCNQGVITRTFKTTDKSNNNATCQQSITVKDPQVFSFNNIIWPNAIVELNGCDESVATQVLTGKPSYNNINCANVAATYNDIIFNDTDGACVKVLREWTVIDWCQFSTNPNSGKWIRNQTIKINNTVKPQFVTSCKDTLLCMYTENCGPEKFIYTPVGSDDCTENKDLLSAWKVDVNNDGTIDFTGTSRTIDINLPQGKHRVIYTFIDKCDNENTCSFFVNAKDCKKPSPYCLSQITSVIMPSSGTLNVKAKTFDIGSSDNCTPKNKLKFSFTSEVKDSTKLITCADIANGVSDTLKFQMWAIDLEGNKEYCKVAFAITDNGDYCQDKNLNAGIECTIYAPDLVRIIGNVRVDFKASNSDYSAVKYADYKGKFTASGFPLNMPIVIKSFRNDSITVGLSTLDIIHMQRHILGLAKFTDPYKLIAADADGNKKVNVSDLVALRKIILGASVSLPQNRPCYTFVDKNFTFTNNNYPWNYPDSIKYLSLESGINKNADFVAIKIGDVNNSIGNIHDIKAENRSANKNIYYKKINNEFVFYFKENIKLNGFQFSIGANLENEKVVQFNEELGIFDFALNKDNINIVFYTSSPKSLELGQWLFKIKADKINSLECDFNQFYDEYNEALKIKLIEDHKLSEESQLIEQNSASAFKVSLEHNFLVVNTNMNFENSIIRIYDVLGRVVWQRKVSLSQGENKFEFNRNTLNKIYFSEIIIDGRKYSNKVLD